MAELRFLRPAERYFKKLKDKQLKALYKEALLRIAADPAIGSAKLGDLAGLYGYDVYYNRTNYEIAYRVEEVIEEQTGMKEIVVVIMAGTRENFYEQLKRYMRTL